MRPMKHRLKKPLKHHLLNYSVAVLLCALSFQAALAASSPWQDSVGGRVRMVVAEPGVGKTSVHAVLQIQLTAGWKTYWRDPGDAGVPPQFDLTGSENLALDGLQFPAPHRFDDGTSVWAGYKEPVAIGIDLTRTDSAKAMRLKGSVFLGVCEKICVPVKVEFDVPLGDAMSSNEDEQLVAATYAALPEAAGGTMKIESAKVDGKQLTLTVATPSATPDLYLAAPQGWQFGAPKLVSATEGKAVFEAAVLYAPKVGVLGEMHYALVSDGVAVNGVLGE